MSDFVCFVKFFSVLEGPQGQILVIFGPWGRQVGIWASRDRFWGPKPGESLLSGYHFGTVLGHFRDLFLRYFWEDLWITFLTILGCSGLHFGIAFVTFWIQKASLHKIMNNLIFAAIYRTSGMSQMPNTMHFLNNFAFCWLFF